MTSEISPEDLTAFRDMAATFAKRSIRPILEHESPDGDLARVPALLGEARDTGLLASWDPDAPGRETGIWGLHALEHGPAVSLMLLAELAHACGGVAMNFHALGLAAMIAAMARNAPGLSGQAAVALCENGFVPGPGTILDPSTSAPARILTTAEKAGDGWKLDGRKDFVWRGPDTAAYLVFAREGKKWAVFAVPADAPGLTTTDAGPRMGLRACQLVHLRFEGVKLAEDARLVFERPEQAVMEYLRRWWLGTAAIGAGIAKSAIEAAREYAAERYQGCTEIINHPAVNMLLLAEAEARAQACLAAVLAAANAEGCPARLLLAAARARLSGLADAASAVTDSLQVFGGYGYMEDYRMEKRCRDVNTLKCAGGGPRELRMMIAGLAGEA